MIHRFLPIALVSTGIAFLSGCGGEAPPPAQMPAPSVTAVVVKPEEVTVTRQLPGRAVSFLIAEVRPQVSGIVQDRLFEEGGLVDAGQPLYQLDDTMYRARLNMEQAGLERAQSSAKLARIEAERAQRLFETNAISRQELDNSLTARQQAEAQVAVAEASLASAQVTLDYSLIVSPISGRIGRSSVTKGALVTANQEKPLAIVQQLDPIYVDISQSSRELLQLRRAFAQGDLAEADVPVTIYLEDGSVYSRQGKIAFSEVSVDPRTGSYTLRVVVDNPDGLLLPGMYLRAEIGEGVKENGILIPQMAVSRAANGSTTVMVVNADDTVEARAVQLGQTIGNRWLVRAGLNEGERIVISGLQKIRPGSKVKVELQAPSAADEVTAK